MPRKQPVQTYIGDRLPDPYYKWAIRKRFVGHAMFRRCKGKFCDYEWTTIEIPAAAYWNGKRADNCPYHPEHQGAIKNTRDPGALADNRQRLSWAEDRALRFGAVYRHRYCKLRECRKHIKKTMPDGRETNTVRRTYWSTLEVWPDGTVVDDVTTCPRCGQSSEVLKGPKVAEY